MSSGRKSGDDAGPYSYRHWVQVRDLRDGSSRVLPLHALTTHSIPRKKSDPPRASTSRLRLEDAGSALEASTFDELVALLQVRYPASEFALSIHSDRDLEAERDLRELIAVLARAAVRRIRQ